MNIKQLVKYDLPDFTGIIVADGAAPLKKIREFGASVAWRFNKENGKKFNKVLIAGNMKGLNKNKGQYFIADIIDCVSIKELAQISKYKEVIDYQNKHFGNWIIKDLNTFPNDKLGVSLRNAILFKNATEIKVFSTSNFSNLSNPVTYII